MRYLGLDQMWVNRTFCAVVEDMRQCAKNLNFGAVAGLLAELQAIGNRMEAALGDAKDYQKVQEELPALRKEYNKLTREIEKLERKKNDR